MFAAVFTSGLFTEQLGHLSCVEITNQLCFSLLQLLHSVSCLSAAAGCNELQLTKKTGDQSVIQKLSLLSVTDRKLAFQLIIYLKERNILKGRVSPTSAMFFFFFFLLLGVIMSKVLSVTILHKGHAYVLWFLQ